MNEVREKSGLVEISFTDSSITINTDALSRRRTKQLRALSQKKYREEYGQFIVEGRRAVDAALEAGAPVRELVVSESAAADPRMQAVVEARRIPLYTCPDAVFDDISQVTTAQGILAVVETRYRAPDELTACQSIVALDGVQDPGNVGTLMRTAAWFDADAVVAGAGTVDLVNPKVVRASMGAHWDLDLARVDFLDEIIEQFTRYGFTPYAADLQGTPVEHWTPEHPSLLVVGSEAHGVSAVVSQMVHERIYVGRPRGDAGRTTGVESLNVAVASGIVLYHWMA